MIIIILVFYFSNGSMLPESLVFSPKFLVLNDLNFLICPLVVKRLQVLCTEAYVCIIAYDIDT